MFVSPLYPPKHLPTALSRSNYQAVFCDEAPAFSDSFSWSSFASILYSVDITPRPQGPTLQPDEGTGDDTITESCITNIF